MKMFMALTCGEVDFFIFMQAFAHCALHATTMFTFLKARAY